MKRHTIIIQNSKIGTQYSQKRTLFKVSNNLFPIVLMVFEPPRRGQPLNKGQNTIVYMVPKCPLFGGSTVYMYEW